MSYKPSIETFAIKHGLYMEQHAKKEYATIKKRKPAKYDSGLVLYDELSYIAASADSEVECKCCGARLVRIQGSLIRGEVLSVDNLGY